MKKFWNFNVRDANSRHSMLISLQTVQKLILLRDIKSDNQYWSYVRWVRSEVDNLYCCGD